MRARKSWKTLTWGILCVTALSVFLGLGQSNVMADWRTANREPTGIAPNPADHPEAIVQIYAARAFGWRGVFGVHTWIAAKRENATAFTVYEVIGWRLYHGGSAVVVGQRPPDARWFGSEPEILSDLRGGDTETVIDHIEDAVARYPYKDTYKVWPGPNSNTFTAFVARAVPELRVDLPPTAVGKDYLSESIFAATPSGTGGQFSLNGLLGFTLALDEGVEFNLLGLTFGVDFTRPAVKFPLAGRIGFANDTASASGR